MTTWRLVRAEYAATALTGEGSARYPGRWNLRGVRVVYVSEHLSLATLEVLAHAESLALLNRYVALRVSIPDSLTALAVSDLPNDWQSEPPPDSARRVGHRWLQKGETLALKVPSALIPSEHNFVLNPAHPAFTEVRVAEPVPLPFDAQRLKVVEET